MSIRVVLERMPVRFMIAALAGIVVVGVLAVALRVEAQQPGKIYRIGVLISASDMVTPTTDAFRDAIRELGYIEGKNYVLETRARGPKTDQLSNLAAELVGLKVDILLTRGFPALRCYVDGATRPAITGDAMKVLQGDKREKDEESILRLIKAVDRYIGDPVRNVDKPFIMPIEDVFSISGRGTVVTGRVERGLVKVGDKVEIVGLKESQQAIVKGIEMFRKILTEGCAGLGALPVTLPFPVG